MNLNNDEINKIAKGIKTAEEFFDLMKDADLEKKIDSYPNIVDYIANNKYSDKLINDFLDPKKYTVDVENKKENIDKFLTSLDIYANSRKNRRIRTIRNRISIAAAVIAITILIWQLYSNNTKNESVAYNTNEVTTETPVIIFSDGQNEYINDSVLVEVADYNKKENKQISKPKQTEDTEVKYNTIIVPSMYTLDIALEDGTKIKLNANSKLKYPTKFNNNKREIFLSGEAYFDVAKGETPFLVNTDNISVKVYGTKFNVNTSKCNTVETTLISGSVGVTILDSNEDEIMINPDQMFILDKNIDSYDVRDVDAKLYIAWMSGYISCHKSNLISLLDELTKWYGTEFIIDSNVDFKTEITISQSNKLSIDEMVAIIGNVTNLTFIKEANNKYLITKKHM